MEQITKKVLKTLLAFVMCFSVLHIPNMGTRVVAEEGDDVIEEVTDEIVEIVQPTVYQAVLDEVTVVATVAEGTFDDEVDLVVEPISKGSAEYQKADETLKNSGADYDGMLAFDIFFKVVETGEKIEPDGSVDVQLSLNSAALAEIAPQIDVDSVNVTHITEAEEVEVVADVFNETAGTVEVKKVGEEVQKLNANFSVGDFSTFTITWTETNEETHEEEEKTATVVWGEIGTGGTITPFEVENVSIDTSAGSVSLANIFDGYEFAQAHYEHGETNVVVDPVLVNDNGVYKLNMHFNDPDHQSVELTAIEDESVIYVGYVPKGEPHDPSPTSVEGPTTIKNVVDNGDGTSSIILDVKGAVKTETTVTGANVLIVLDRTKSMRYNMGNDQIARDEANNRWTVARAAIDLLVTTLSTGDNAGNDVEYSLISFYNRIDSPIHTWGTDEWTSNATTYNAYIQGDTLEPIGANDNTNNGTNWEDPLYRALRVAQAKNTAENNKDKTYVIFVTDGSPNARGTGEDGNGYTGYVRNGQTAAVNAARPQAVALYSDSNIEFYGVFCGASAGGYDTLDGMLTAAAATAGKTNRPATINGADEAAINAAFANIASTISESFGATNTTVDDGVTSLSSVSAMVSGEAGGFEYYKTNQYDEDGKPINFSTWENPAGASYSEDNGVTWDLSSVGQLEDKVTYRLIFKVWASQEAFDLIADLNNETKKITDLDADTKEQIRVEVGGNKYNYNKTTGKWTGDLTDEELQAIIEAGTASYFLKTNTHLQTTYTYNGVTYTDQGIEESSGSLVLESSQMKVMKAWDDDINRRNRAVSVDFYLKVDGKYYQNDGSLAETTTNAYTLNTSETNDWQSEVNIAPGVATSDGSKTEDGAIILNVLETGHAYSLEEKASEGMDSYAQEFTSQTVRPLRINDVLTYLILVDDDNPLPEGETIVTYVIDDVLYYVDTVSTGVLTGTNHKTSELDILKHIDEEKSLTDMSAEDLNEETFTYKVTLTVPEGTTETDKAGIGYWIYVPVTEGGWTLPEYGMEIGTGEGQAEYGAADFRTDYINGTVKFKGDNWEETENGNGSSHKDIEWNGNVGTITVTINRTQVIRFTNLPTGTTYEIEETLANDDTLANQGYRVDELKYIDTTAGNVKTATEGTKITGTVGTFDTRYYNRFTNVIDAVDAEIKVKKVIDGRSWNTGESFIFTLVAGTATYEDGTTGTSPMPEETELTVTDGNLVSFGEIRYPAEGTYEYTITETNGGEIVGDLQYAANPAATIVVTVSRDEDTNKLYVSAISGGTFTAASEGKVATVEATVTNTFVKTKVTVTKVWAGVDEKDIPESIAMLLKANGVEAGNATLTAENEWTYTWTGLQAYEDGKAIEYTVEEPNVPTGYTVSGGTVSGNVTDGYQVTFTNTRDTAQLKLTKVVVGDVEVPATTTFTVTGPKEFGTVTLTYAELENGVKDFGEVPTGEYFVTETGAGIEGYTLVTTIDHDSADNALTLEKGDEGELTVTNTYTRDTAKLKLVKVVVGDVEVPATTTFTVSGPADFGTNGSMTVSYSDLTNNEYDFGTVPTGDYTVTESGAEIEGYTLVTTTSTDTAALTLEKGDEGELTVTNTYTRDTASLVLKKVVQGDVACPGTATFTVSGPADFGTNGSMTVTYSQMTNGSYDFGQVPTGKYSVTEDGAGVEGYSLVTTISDPVTLEKGGSGELTVTNKYTIDTYNVTITKIFDIEDIDKIPENFAIDITIGTNTDTLTLEDEGVVVSSDGTTYTWTLEDVPYGSVVGAEEKNYQVDGFTWTGTTTTASVTVSTDSEKNVITFTNPYTRNNYELTVTKVFDIDDLDKIPEGFEIDLTYGETTVVLKLDDEGVEVTENGTTYTWKVAGIPYETEVSWEEKGYEITGFTWTGTAYEGEVTISADTEANILTVTNPYTRNVYKLNVVKTFYIDDYSKIPDDFYITCSIDGVDKPDLTLKNAEKVSDNEFRWIVEYVPYESEVVLEEKNYDIPGYQLVSAILHYEEIVENEETVSFSNVYERLSYEITVTKEFTGITAEMIPEDFQISITVDGEEIQVLKITDEDVVVDGLKYTWTLSEKIPYETEITAKESGTEIFGATLSEEAVTEVTLVVDVEDNVMALTNPYTIDTFEVVVTKEWDDNNDQDGFRAKLGATVQLYKQLAGENEKTKVGDPVTVGTGDDWSNTWKDLPAYENGKLVTYSVEETYADETLNYEKTIGDPVKYTGEVSETIEVKNTHAPEKVDVPVTKEWAGDEGFTEYRPEKIVVELFADGKSIGEEGVTAELTAENEWTYTFEGLDKYADGKEIEYTVDETEIVNGYVKKVEKSEDGGYVIINTFEPIHFDPPVMKTVKGDDVPEDTFKFQFEGLDGAPMPEGAEGQIMTCELKAGESHEFGDVYLVEPGTYEYKITEINDGKEGYAYDAGEYLLEFVIGQEEDGTLTCKLTINGEEADYQNLTPSQFEFVNEYREYIDIEVVKVWDDNDDAEGKRPDEIEVTLYANDEAVETVVLNEENNWSYSWIGFEYSDENFEEIQYTVKEDKVPEGYSMSHKQDGYKITITNSINPPETGDSNNMKLWAALFTLSLTNTAALAVALKKRKEEEE